MTISEELQYVEVQLLGWHPTKRAAALAWCDDVCTLGTYSTALGGNYIYFDKEQDATMFMLRYS